MRPSSISIQVHTQAANAGGARSTRSTPARGIPQEFRHHILGGQCCNWSEYTWNEYDLEWKM